MLTGSGSIREDNTKMVGSIAVSVTTATVRGTGLLWTGAILIAVMRVKVQRYQRVVRGYRYTGSTL